MKRAAPPSVATWFLKRFVWDEALVGDLTEEFRAGRSRIWYWRQVLAAVVMGSAKAVGEHKLTALLTVAEGWAVLLLIFTFLGDRVAYGLAYQIWGWTREIGYSSRYVWQPFWITGAFVSYAGFAISAWAVARFSRTQAGPMLCAYLVSVVVVLTSAATFVAWKAPAPVSVPHPLFYLVTVTLPYQWRTGFVFVPLVILIAGLWSTAPTKTHAAIA